MLYTMHMKTGRALIGIAFVAVLAGAYIAFTKPMTPNNNLKNIPAMTITSGEFASGASIPSRFTCDGEDISPTLSIAGIPKDAKTLVLIMDDPDSPTGTWDHWVLFNIPAQSESLHAIPAGQEPQGVQGKNSWGRLGYGGPCPGKGIHRYYFKVYALDIELPLSAGSAKKQEEEEMAGHALAYGELIGRYQRV